MADLNILRAARAAWIPLMVGLGVVLALIFSAAREDGEDDTVVSSRTDTANGPQDRPTGTTGLAPVPVYEYMEFAGVIATPIEREMSLRHDYTADGLRMLANALEATAAEHPDLAAKIGVDDLRAQADRLQQDPHAHDHAEIVRTAFTSAAEMIRTLSPEAGARLHTLAADVATDQPLLAQRESVRTFFRESAEALGDFAESE